MEYSTCKNLFLLAALLVTFLNDAEVNGFSFYEKLENSDNFHYLENDNRLPEVQGVAEEEWGMVQRKDHLFILNGQPFYVNGFNTYWLMILAADQSTRGKVSDVFQLASSVGLTVCRTWAFNDGGWRALQKSPSVYDEEVFKALDFVLSEAKKYKIRLILTLTNNWDGFGGRAQYVNWGKSTGLNLTSKDDFYSDPTVKGYYKHHVETILNRVNTITNLTYKDDPTVFAWELMNEPQCQSDPSGDKLQEWIEEMALHVKSIDPSHLLGTGSEGFYGASTPENLETNPNSASGQSGTDFIRNHRAFGIDFASAHIYPDAWISNEISESHLRFVSRWMESHIADGEARLGMPVVFGEFGVSKKEVGYNSSFRDAFFDAVYSALLNSTRSGGAGGGGLLWQLLPSGTEYMDDGYAVVGRTDGSGSGSAESKTMGIVSRQSWRVQQFNSRCGWRCSWMCRKAESTGWI